LLGTRITLGNIQFEEFQRCHQVGRVDDYIKKFENAKSKVMQISAAFTEEVFVAGFVSGLKDEIKHMVNMFQPTTFNEAFQYALQYEFSQESQQRRAKLANKPLYLQNYPGPGVK